MASHCKLDDPAFKLVEHAEHDIGTRFSSFGYSGSSDEFLDGGGDLTGVSDAKAVLVLEDPPEQIAEPSSSACKVRFLPMRGSKLDVNVTFETVDGAEVEYSFFVDASGGILNLETRWINVLRNCMRLGVLFSPAQDSSGYLVEIDDPDDEGRKTLVAASSQLPYYAWEGAGRLSILD